MSALLGLADKKEKTPCAHEEDHQSTDDEEARQREIDKIDPCFNIKEAIELKLDGELYKSYRKNPNFVRDKWAQKAQRRHRKFKNRKEHRVKTQTLKVLKAWRKQNLKNSKQTIEKETSKPRPVKSKPVEPPQSPDGLTLTDKYFPAEQNGEKNHTTVSVSDDEFWSNRQKSPSNKQQRNKSVNDRKNHRINSLHKD